ncbi:winged helix-turn-helix domain-containing protein [Sphingomonas sp. LB-2]|uniref:winged helix-turn-helix domain-containing protein n=1 Tax=Sphingomonas caeni TaxID=2984949 RepID=UPI00223252EB|nr:winged helix-turn-helix domain-containing protein [Sphingomonas caeni]MCW3847205.1 winged helix-turn-helix domain-containing protein [Sphingomonas caeni]
MEGQRIDLGEAGEQRLGGVLVLPSLRTLRRADGAEQVIEPRMMQVLIALAEAGGGVVTRDMLTRRCWEGRVIGEDAINRVISRLRRTAQEFCGGGFEIETVTKVGYRLLVDGAPPAPPVEVAPPRLNRRALIGGGAALGIAAASGLAWWGSRDRHAVPAEVAPFVDQGMAAMREQNDRSYTRAINLLRHVVDVRPDYADGWGMLACAYVVAGKWRGPPSFRPFAALARAAAARAEQLDPGNAMARAGMTMLLTRQGNQIAMERALRAAVAAYPHQDLMLGALAGLMMSVGRCREAARLYDQALLSAPPSVGTLYERVQALWAADRLAEADRAIEQVYALYPTDLAVWFTRFYLLLHTGRADQALAQGRNLAGRPQDVPRENIEIVMVVAEAAVSRKAADIDKALAANVAAAHRGAGFAENAMQFAVTLGRIDTAFELAQAYYFARGFRTGEARFPPLQGGFTPQNARRTHLLFMPSTAAMRRDARFDPIVAELGLKRYWDEAGVKPDYLA